MNWRNRIDPRNSLHFVTVKGVGGLPVFATNDDVRIHQAQMAREVRRGELAVVHFVYVGNHAHHILFSPHGALHRPMQRIQEGSALHHNRTRDRSGHVFKDRFHSSRVSSTAYLFALICYMDANVRKAGLAATATVYPYSSAFHCVRPHAPGWLSRERVLKFVPGAAARGHAEEASYLRTFRGAPYDFIAELSERRMHAEKGLPDVLDTFLVGSSASRIRWIREQAARADGTRGPRLLADPRVLKEILERRAGECEWGGRRSGSGFPWRALLVGLLHDGCARSGDQIRSMISISQPTVSRETRRHRERLLSDPAYLALAEEILSDAVRLTWGFCAPFAAADADGFLCE